MRPYGTVSPLFWIGNTGKKLRADRDAQVIALYLMTNPHSHQTGIYHLPLLYLATEIGIEIDGALKALRRLEGEGFCRYDDATEWVWVCEMAAWQIGESLKDADKRAIGVRQYLDTIPKCPFIAPFVARYAAHYHLVLVPQTGASLHPSKGLMLIRREQKGTEQRSAEPGAPPSKVLDGAEGNRELPPKSGGTRGSRLPEDFQLDPSRARFASEAGVDPERTFAKFRDYWRAATKNATKLDWDATWRNWCRAEAERNPRAKGGADNGLPFAN